MKWGALIGWGITIYAVLSLAWSGLVIYGVAQGLAPRLVELCVLILLALIAGRSLHFSSLKDILPYSFAWAIEAVVLDAIYTVPFSGWGVYSNITLWLGYGVLVIVPLFAVAFRRVPELPAHLST